RQETVSDATGRADAADGSFVSSAQRRIAQEPELQDVILRVAGHRSVEYASRRPPGKLEVDGVAGREHGCRRRMYQSHSGGRGDFPQGRAQSDRVAGGI